jgi:hypothetical protein
MKKKKPTKPHYALLHMPSAATYISSLDEIIE